MEEINLPKWSKSEDWPWNRHSKCYQFVTKGRKYHMVFEWIVYQLESFKNFVFNYKEDQETQEINCREMIGFIRFCFLYFNGIHTLRNDVHIKKFGKYLTVTMMVHIWFNKSPEYMFEFNGISEREYAIFVDISFLVLLKLSSMMTK